ncbi:MAG TPA: hypothetical protein VLH85_05195 [Levilinea sp.]|nr:hypothetical protein [Levilinea sp.]
MNRLKFMNAPVDQVTHLEAHTPAGVRRVVDETGCNWIYLTYNWGFPPEQEVEDWEAFSSAAKAYQAAGAKVFAYIQTSNCVYDGSFKLQDWYALDARGRRIYYYTGRYMTCWQHPAWIAHLEHMITGAIQRGADGIFFDNPWYAAQPVALFGSWHGSAGCHCQRCQEKYLQETGQTIPTHIHPSDHLIDAYIRWRANQVTLTLAHYCGYAKFISPDIPVSVNNFDAVMRPSYLIYGIDLKALSSVQDIIMIENFGLPALDAHPHKRLPNNALTIRTARAIVKSTPISVDPYDRGIGFDRVFPARRYLQGIAESIACGASMVIKGTEFIDKNVFTLLTAPQYYETRREIGRYHAWLEQHLNLFTDRTSRAPVALLYPGDSLWQDWPRHAPRFFGACQALLAAGIPWKVILPGDDPGDLQAVIICSGNQDRFATSPDIPIISLDDLPAWVCSTQPNFMVRFFSRPINLLVACALRAYFGSPLTRRLMDLAGVMRLFTSTPLYNLPTRTRQASLLAALPADIYPRLHAKKPALIEVWERSGIEEIHLVNYAGHNQEITVDFGVPRDVQILSPDHPPQLLSPAVSIDFTLDVYAILTARPYDSSS